MKVKLLSVGKIKNAAFAELAEDYTKRIQRFHPFESIVIPDELIKGKSNIEKVLDKEALRIDKQLKTGSYLIALDERGEQWSSVDLSWELKKLFETSHKEIVFLIGGAHGLSSGLKRRAQALLSLSKLTLPHQLARVLALEQIYRALTILRNVPYHNE